MNSTMSSRTFIAAMLAMLLLAIGLRTIFPTADPPWRTTVGVVWHDEGAWTHNARNRALFGQWRLDAWNPIFLAPVFTGLEYASFATFGVGTWQARLVSEAAGTVAVLLLALGVARVGGRFAGIIAGLLLATNYVYVMYDRAAIMEGSMAAFVVVSWYGFVRAQRQPAWGLVAAVAAYLAYFTKAAAAFSLAALALTCLWSLIAERDAQDERPRAAAMWTLAGLFAAGVIALAVFVLPWWSEYRFYNWQMSVTRKPSYDLKSLIDRVSWFPVLHDVFTRMWPVYVVGLIGWATRAVRWRKISAPERLLVLWVGIGVAEMILHDVGNERRFVFLLPAFVALASLTLAHDFRLLPTAAETAGWTRRRALLLLPFVLYLAYVAIGPLARLAYLYEVGPSARLTGALAVIATALLYLTWPRLIKWASAAEISPRSVAILTALIVIGNLVQFGQWAVGRSYKNYEASRALAQILPPGTLVHGKLANGLDLENKIKPIFVGRGFGNYDDRLRRDDVPYILTYVAPKEGYEGPVILDVLQAYPQRRIIWTVDVAETEGGHDRAALIEKEPRETH